MPRPCADQHYCKSGRQLQASHVPASRSDKLRQTLGSPLAVSAGPVIVQHRAFLPSLRAPGRPDWTMADAGEPELLQANRLASHHNCPLPRSLTTRCACRLSVFWLLPLCFTGLHAPDFFTRRIVRVGYFLFSVAAHRARIMFHVFPFPHCAGGYTVHIPQKPVGSTNSSSSPFSFPRDLDILLPNSVHFALHAFSDGPLLTGTIPSVLYLCSVSQLVLWMRTSFIL